MKTIGEHRVRTEFNPSNDSMIDQIKQRSAELIDLIARIPDGTSVDKEAGRLKALAMTAVEEASMWGVKAATCKVINEKQE